MTLPDPTGKLELIQIFGDRVTAAISLKDPTKPGNYTMRRPSPFWNGRHARENLRDFAATLGFDPEKLVLPRRWPHLSRVMVVGPDNVVVDPFSGLNPCLPQADRPGFEHSCDGLVTQSDEIVLGVQGADCTMLYLHDKPTSTIGVFHCGWRPVARRIIRKAVDSFLQLGADPSTIKAFIGPGAGDDVYEFAINDTSRPVLLEWDRVGDFEAKLQPMPGKPGEKSLRLNALVFEDLVVSGLNPANIANDTRSTIKDPRFHSYRRDGHPDMSKSQHGLGIGVIYLS